VVEDERDRVREAFEVLTDPVRRRRYDLLRYRDEEGLDGDLAEILEPALVDPTAAAAVEVVRSLTNLEVGEPFTAPEVERTEPVRRPVAHSQAVFPTLPTPRAPRAVSLLSQEEREDRAQAAVAAVPDPPAVISIVPQEPPTLEEADLEGVARNLGHDGRYITKVRESKGVNLATLSEDTKIAQRYLTAIEENAFDRLPAPVFVRGYLREIAAVLGIDEGALVDGYMALYEQHRGG